MLMDSRASRHKKKALQAQTRPKGFQMVSLCSRTYVRADHPMTDLVVRVSVTPVVRNIYSPLGESQTALVAGVW